MGRYINTGLTLSTAGAKKIFFNTGAAATQTWTVPAGVTCASFEIWGGGGAGSPSCCCTCYGGTAGSGGAYSLKTIPVTPGSVYTMSIGQGGCGNMCYYNPNACGCCGFTTYVTGLGLSNFCAEGGQGGYWCNSIPTPSQALAYGGDLNIKGTSYVKTNKCLWQGNPGGIQAGGASPFGGGYQWHPYNVGSASNPLSCGLTGIFPGGGSPARHQWNDGWCDCCTGCTGGGADGLVVITI
jgi:hypothetical protein